MTNGDSAIAAVKTSTRIAAGVAALITALSLSACSSAPVDPDRHACEGIATWLADGQPADERADVAARALRHAEDVDLIARIESWQRADKESVAALRLDTVAVRCLQLRDERAWRADR